MSKRIYAVVMILILISMVGFIIGAEVGETKPTGAVAGAVKTEAKKPTLGEKTEAKKPTLEEKTEALRRNQERMLAELKEIKQNQEEILQQTRKIFIYMKRR